MDYAQARYDASAQGRFIRVDPLLASADVASPQSLNRYSYVENNPLNLTDPTGMAPYRGADQSFTDVSDGFWGSARDFSQPPMSRGRIIIAAAMYVQGALLQTHFEGQQVTQYLRDGNNKGAAAVLARSPGGVGIEVDGTTLWGGWASDFLLGVDSVNRQIAGAGSTVEWVFLTRRLMFEGGWRQVLKKLQKIREPDFLVLCAVIGVGRCNAIARGDGIEALTNPLISFVGSISREGGPGLELSLAFGWLGQASPPPQAKIRDWLSGQSWTLSGFKKAGGGVVFSRQSPYFAVLLGIGLGGKGFTESHTKSYDEWVKAIRRVFPY